MAQSHAQLSQPDVISTTNGNLTIQPVQHASLAITAGGKTVYIDPSGADFFKGLPAPGLVLVTDIHGDHFDMNTINALAPEGTVIVVPQAVADMFATGNKYKLVILKNGESTEQQGFSVTALPMYNLPEEAGAFHTKGRGNGYVLTYGGKRLYFSGDTEDIPEMRALKNIDIAFVCMNLPYTMEVEQAADAVLAFKPVVVYPYHYRGQGGLSDTHAFKELVSAGNTGIEVRLRNWYPAK